MGSTGFPEREGGVAQGGMFASTARRTTYFVGAALLTLATAAAPTRGAPGDAPGDAPATRPATTAVETPATGPATAPGKTYTIANIAFAYSAGSAMPVPEAEVRHDATVRL